jgi:streptogramin lyase
MSITRRGFLTASSAFAAAWAASSASLAQEPAITGEGNRAASIPTRQAKVERLFKAPDVHPNALEAAADGLWIGDQVSERVFKVDWQTGKVLHQVQTESHNTSGLAVGGGYLWLGANGGVSGRRPPRGADKPFGEIVQADIDTGKTVKVFRPPWRGGVHGITWVEQTHTLWSTALNISALAELDPKDNLRILRVIPVKGDRPHGLDWQDGAIWCLFAGDRVIHKLDPDSGKILEVIALSRTSDPDPHGMCIHDGYMYYCDAGLTAPGPGSEPSLVCRFKLA